jgi:HTH-type transcriptional regulator/antitoxin HigA
VSTPVTVHPIRDEASYDAAVAEVRKLWGATSGTPAGDRLDVLLVLVDAYEAEHHAVDLPDPIAAIQTRMEDLGLTRYELGEMLGLGSGRVSEILNRRRRLTLPMIRTLAATLGLSEACLVQAYDLAAPHDPAPGPEQAARRVA